MFNFEIHFARPWLLLLLIPAVILTLIPYFRLMKRYRRTRNRICSIILHLCVFVLCITVLAGIGFSYDVHNSKNEIMLVVDASYSTEEEKTIKENYIQDVIAMSDSNVYKLGIVTFGYNQTYAAPLTNDYADLYEQYLEAETPDVSGTNIADALIYAKGLFNYPETAKIVLISDGLETDYAALAVIKSLTATGMRVDTVACSTLKPNKEIQLIDTTLPDYNIPLNKTFELALNVNSKAAVGKTVNVTIYDNDVKGETVATALVPGTQAIAMNHSFKEGGLHALRFELQSEDDTVKENNTLCTYIHLEIFDKILVIEKIGNSSQELMGLLRDYTVTIKQVGSEGFPASLEELRQYDEIILNNIANKDLPDGFDMLLNKYVYEVGGGLFTLGGGEDGDPDNAHAYNRKDLEGSLLQQMLPVQAIDYTPPLGVMLVIDVSGSMGNLNTDSKLDAARDSALSIVRDNTCLSERDYCGVMTLSDDYKQETSHLLPMTKQYDIETAISNIEKGTTTVFTPAIERASMDLLASYNNNKIEKMQVIVISDGMASDFDDYYKKVQDYNKLGVRFSFVAIEPQSDSEEQLNKAAEAGGGEPYIVDDIKDLTITLKDDIRLPEIKEVEQGEFTPTIDSEYYEEFLKQEDMPKLEGFYGTRPRSEAEVVLAGNYGVPLYAQWKYGNGMVGSFMCDLMGVWSRDFLDAEAGKGFLLAVVNYLFPTENIRPKGMDVHLQEDNYNTQVSIYTKTPLEKGETVRLKVEHVLDENAKVTVVAPSAKDGYTRGAFEAMTPGVYAVVVEKVKADGTVAESILTYKEFSYSKEYDTSRDEEEGINLLANIAENGAGKASLMKETDPWWVFEGFVTSIHKTYDPRFVFLIIAICLFLLDIAVRKFKFKWLHEIIRERKKNFNSKKGA